MGQGSQETLCQLCFLTDSSGLHFDEPGSSGASPRPVLPPRRSSAMDPHPTVGTGGVVRPRETPRRRPQDCPSPGKHPKVGLGPM
jgi:hypothetical protein